MRIDQPAENPRRAANTAGAVHRDFGDAAMTSLHEIAIDVLVEESELCEGPDHYVDASEWPAWTDSVCYEVDGPIGPDEDEIEEAIEMFETDEVEDFVLSDEVLSDFDEFIGGLDDESFVATTRAIEVIRGTLLRYRIERPWNTLNMRDILAALE
jgi:hypothetical protein